MFLLQCPACGTLTAIAPLHSINLKRKPRWFPLNRSSAQGPNPDPRRQRMPAPVRRLTRSTRWPLRLGDLAPATRLRLPRGRFRDLLWPGSEHEGEVDLAALLGGWPVGLFSHEGGA